MIDIVFRDAETWIPQRFPVPEGKVRMGCAAGNEIRPLIAGISRYHADVSRTGRRVVIDDAGSKNGILVRGVRVSSVPLQPGDPPVQIGAAFVTVEEADTADHTAAFPVERVERPERTKITLPLHALRDATAGKELHRVVRKSKAMQRVVFRALAFARSSSPILLLGETGTGKEVIAQLIAGNSERPRPFHRFNCASMTAELIASELLGIEDGVATGVRARPGLFATTEGGTLFLDEIGEITEQMQATLLRAIETNVIWPLGARAPRPVHVRVILATNAPANLRKDLYFRCKRILIPPLRERPEDVAALAQHFVEQACAAHGIEPMAISRKAVAFLTAHAWPGNARELQGVLDDAVLLCRDVPMLQLEHVESVIESYEPAARTLRERQDALTRDVVLRALEEHRGNKSAAARSIGASRNGLEKTMRRLGIGR